MNIHQIVFPLHYKRTGDLELLKKDSQTSTVNVSAKALFRGRHLFTSHVRQKDRGDI